MAIRIERLRSISSNETLHVRFINKTSRVVDILWMNYTGVAIKYRTLKQNEWLDINTYTTHPWICLDSFTGDQMLINNKRVFYGETVIAKLRKIQEERGANFRIGVVITFPLMSLKKLALLSVRDHLGHTDKIDNLEIPRELKEELLDEFTTASENLKMRRIS